MNRRYFLLLLPCILLLLCTGCGIYLEYLTVTFPALPEGQQAVILLHPPEGWVDEAAERPETEIGQYCDDGWMAADFAPLALNITGYTRHFLALGGNDPCSIRISAEGGWDSVTFRRFCMQYGRFRAAVVDADGNILRISGECSLLPGERFGSPDSVRLDPETMTLTPERWIPARWHGHTVSWWYWHSVLLMAAFALIAVPLILAREKRKLGRVPFAVMLTICLLPVPLCIGVGIVYFCIPYFSLDNSAWTPDQILSAFWPLLLVIPAVLVTTERNRKENDHESSETL